MPVWGSLIGLLHNGRPAYGMMVQPFTLERFTGDGRGAVWRGPGCDHRMTERKLATRGCHGLAQATLMTTSPLLYTASKLTAFRRVEARARLSRYGGDCYAFAMLAAGHVNCVIESGLQIYILFPSSRSSKGRAECHMLGWRQSGKRRRRCCLLRCPHARRSVKLVAGLNGSSRRIPDKDPARNLCVWHSS